MPAPQQVGDVIGRKVAKRGGDYDFDGEIVAMVRKKSGAIRYVVEDARGLLLIMNAKQCAIGDHLAREGVEPENGEGK